MDVLPFVLIVGAWNVFESFSFGANCVVGLFPLSFIFFFNFLIAHKGKLMDSSSNGENQGI